MKFLVDNQLPAALARFLQERGWDSQHVLDLGMDEASDNEIWQYAASQQMVIISKDEDFFHLANRTDATVSLVWVRLGNCRTETLLKTSRECYRSWRLD